MNYKSRTYSAFMTYVMSLMCVLSIGLGFADGLNAQTKLIAHDFSVFNSIQASSNIDVTVEKSNKYTIRAEVDEAIGNYLQTYVKDGVLNIELDKSSLPSEVKKLYRGRNARKPVLKVKVFMPLLKEIKLKSHATLRSNSVFENGVININLSDQAQITGLNVICETLSLNMSNDSYATLMATSKHFDANMVGSSSLNIKLDDAVKSGNISESMKSRLIANKAKSSINLKAKGHAGLYVDSNYDIIDVNFSNSATAILKGKTDSLNVNAEGSASIEALELHNKVTTAKLKGATLSQAATSNLILDLEGRSLLIFAGKPLFNILNIKNSSVRPCTDEDYARNGQPSK